MRGETLSAFNPAGYSALYKTGATGFKKMFWNSRLHNGIQKSWNLPLGKKLGEHWSNFPTNPEVRRQADGQADTESSIFRSCTFKAGRKATSWARASHPERWEGHDSLSPRLL